jgi:hypothetical protein
MGDVISLWNYGENEPRGFLDHINTYDRYLQFTLPFLDVIIIRSIDKLDLTIYRKPI